MIVLFCLILGSTNRILQDKTSLFDVFCDGPFLRSARSLLKPSRTEVQQIASLLDNHNSLSRPLDNIADNSLEKILRYFQQRNAQIFSILHRIAMNESNVIDSGHIKSMGLCSGEDEPFIRELATVHGFDVRVDDSWLAKCCPPSIPCWPWAC